MQYIYDYIKNQNSGTVKSWTMNKTKCRALVRDDGKILSIVDCWDGLDDYQLPSETGRIIYKENGRFLIEPDYTTYKPRKRFEI